MSYHLTQLFIYPIKSLGGISLQEVELTSRGLKHDRRWMLVDDTNRFISQREHHQLCMFDVRMESESFLITYQNETISIPVQLEYGNAIEVTIWDDTVIAWTAEPSINNWFGKHLNQPVTLVYMPEQSERHVDVDYANNDEIVSFADGYPLLLIGETSLQLLQSKVNISIDAKRFRPNLLFKGGYAHQEDTWKHFSINNLPFIGVKPCARCLVTTIDPLTGITSIEPLKTLATYRQKDHKILFGQNVMAKSNGLIKVGDAIKIQDNR